MKLAAHGIAVEVPAGWDGRIGVRRDGDPEVLATFDGGAIEVTPRPVLHVANFALPEERGDFGSGAVELMGPEDVLVIVFDHGSDAAGTPLFATHGLPRTLDPAAFDPQMLQRVIPGQAGYQTFCTEAGRALCLYVVLGSWTRRHRLVPLAERIVASLTIEASE